MLIFSLRTVRSCASSSARRSRPSTSTVPALGSMSRLSSRTSVDLPDPDNPITTNSSPRSTVKLTSWTASVAPVRRRISVRPSPSPASRSASCSRAPKTFVRPETRSTGGVMSADPLVDLVGVVVDPRPRDGADVLAVDVDPLLHLLHLLDGDAQVGQQVDEGRRLVAQVVARGDVGAVRGHRAG